MNIIVNDVGGEYKEIILEDGNTKVSSGALNASEVLDCVAELSNAITQLVEGLPVK